MTADFETVFAKLKPVLEKHSKRLAVRTDTSVEYTLVTKCASPFPQHKGHPMFFGSVRVGKAYVSFHLMPLYMNPVLTKAVSPVLKKRMQGQSCFNFRSDPEPEVLSELAQLTGAAVKQWGEKKWL